MTSDRTAGPVGVLAFSLFAGSALARTEQIRIELAVDLADPGPGLVVRSNSSPCQEPDGSIDAKCIFFAGARDGDGKAKITFELANGGCGGNAAGFVLYDGGFQLANGEGGFGEPVADRIQRDFRGAKGNGKLDPDARPDRAGFLPTRASGSGRKLWIWNQYEADEPGYVAWYQLYATPCEGSLEHRLQLDPRMRNGGDQ